MFPDTTILMMDTELQAECLHNYWIAYVRDSSVLASDCVKTQPRWMMELRHQVGSIPLHALFIPGAHNAGAYKRLKGFSDDTVMFRYSVNQEEDVWSQLLLGIRYFDLRVSYYGGSMSKFWLVHDFVKMNPLSETIHAVKRFLRSTRELVILDFHRFPMGMSEGNWRWRHRELVNYLLEELGEFMVPDSVGRTVTLDTLW